jgi:IS4 transposase
MGRVLGLYEQRWQVEHAFRVLKSGCGMEKLQLESPARVLNALARVSGGRRGVPSISQAGRCPEG